MGRYCLLLLIVSMLSAPAYARWHRVAEVDDVAITVREVPPHEIRKLQLRYTDHRTPDRHLMGGFSVLVRKGTEYFCTIYTLDASDESDMAHEERHCHGWAHD